MPRTMDALTSVSIPRISRPDDPQLVRAINQLAQQPLATAAAVEAITASGLACTALITGNHTAAPGELVVISGGAGLEVTLPATPAADSLIGVYVTSASGATILRNGATINDAASDSSSAQNTVKFFHYDAARDNWISWT